LAEFVAAAASGDATCALVAVVWAAEGADEGSGAARFAGVSAGADAALLAVTRFPSPIDLAMLARASL